MTWSSIYYLLFHFIFQCPFFPSNYYFFIFPVSIILTEFPSLYPPPGCHWIWTWYWALLIPLRLQGLPWRVWPPRWIHGGMLLMLLMLMGGEMVCQHNWNCLLINISFLPPPPPLGHQRRPRGPRCPLQAGLHEPLLQHYGTVHGELDSFSTWWYCLAWFCFYVTSFLLCLASVFFFFF